MTERQLKWYIKNLFKYKTITPKQFMVAKDNLEKIKDSDQLFYYFYMGKLQTAFGNSELAIYYLKKAIELKPDKASIYYNLYKCYVKNSNIDEALKCLEEYFKYNNVGKNFDFTMQIIKTIQALDINYLAYLNSNLTVADAVIVGCNNLSDNEQLLEEYKLVIQSFNNRDYVTCLKRLHIMNSIINEINYPMEVDTLISLIRILKEKEVKSCKKALSDKCMENSSNECFSKFQIRLLEIDYYNPESFLRMAKELADADICKAKSLLDDAYNHPKLSAYLDIIEYLYGIIRGKNEFLNLSEEKQVEFTTKRLKAKSLYKNKHDEQSLEEYCALKEDFKLSICDYYVGKIYFRKEEYNQAKECFLSYLEQGGIKTQKAYLFLGEIEKIQNNIPESRKYFGMNRRINNVFDYNYVSNKSNKKKVAIEEDIYDEYDVVKTRKSRRINMSVEGFANIDFEYDVQDFYEVGIRDKLNIIRGLLQNGNTKLANKLFEEVQRDCSKEERRIVQQFGRNRKIYKNQNRTL